MRLTGISVCFLSSIFNWKLDLNHGTLAWMVPNGDGPRDHPLLKALNLPPPGMPSYGPSGSTRLPWPFAIA